MKGYSQSTSILHLLFIYSHDGKTPLLCAAEAGHDEIVAYLLQFRKVQNDQQIHKKEVHSSRVSYN